MLRPRTRTVGVHPRAEPPPDLFLPCAAGQGTMHSVAEGASGAVKGERE